MVENQHIFDSSLSWKWMRISVLDVLFMLMYNICIFLFMHVYFFNCKMPHSLVVTMHHSVYMIKYWCQYCSGCNLNSLCSPVSASVWASLLQQRGSPPHMCWFLRRSGQSAAVPGLPGWPAPTATTRLTHRNRWPETTGEACHWTINRWIRLRVVRYLSMWS